MQQVLDFLKHTAIKVGLFLRSNWAYLLWGVFHIVLAYFILCGFLGTKEAGLQATVIIYGCSLAFALSPVGEFIVRALEGARPVKTMKDKNYLMPLFEEVYEEARTQTPSISKKIKLYLSEDKYVNAFAIGRRTVGVSRGAMESMGREELKGLIAHEFGHMAHGDTKALMITLVGNGFFSAIVFGCKMIMRFMVVLWNIFSSSKIQGRAIVRITGNLIWFSVRMLFSYSISLFLLLGSFLLALNSRYSEYLADHYAFQIGYGEQLKEALYMLNNSNMGGMKTLKQLLRARHPHITDRIARLEQKLGLMDDESWQSKKPAHTWPGTP